MAIPQSTPSCVVPRTLSPQQFLDLFQILRTLDLELNFARGVPDDRMLKIAFPISCARAFLRAHEALERERPFCPMMEIPSTDPGGEPLNPDLAFSTTTELTAWIDEIELYVDGYLENHAKGGRA